MWITRDRLVIGHYGLLPLLIDWVLTKGAFKFVAGAT